jgi:hypothetical protein
MRIPVAVRRLSKRGVTTTGDKILVEIISGLLRLRC